MGFEIVARSSQAFDVLLAVRDARADVAVLVADDDEEPGLVSHLLGEYPDLTVLTFFPEGRAVIAQRCPTRLCVDHPSPRELLRQMRDAVFNPCSMTTGATTPTGRNGTNPGPR